MTVYIKKNESLESAINRFHSKVEKAGIVSEYRSKTAFRSKKELQRVEAWEKNKKRTKRQK